MKRPGFKRPSWSPPPKPIHKPLSEPARAVMTKTEGVAQPKVLPVRSKPYLRAVAKLRCYRCKVEGYTQACHGDFNKAMQSKTSDLTAWPGCCERPGVEGCHHYVSRVMTREQRREFEKEAAAATILQLIVASQDTGKEAAALRKVLRDVGLVA